MGCVVIRAKNSEGEEGSLPLKEPPLLATWMARVSCNLLLNKADRKSLLVRLGVDVTDKEQLERKKAKAAATLAAQQQKGEKVDGHAEEEQREDAVDENDGEGADGEKIEGEEADRMMEEVAAAGGPE